jgi:hypothetical protein
MDTVTLANQLKGYVESLKLSDNISKPQLEMLYLKLDLLIDALNDNLWENISTISDKPVNKIPIEPFIEEEHDDLPF